MATESTQASDRGIGLALGLGTLAVLAALLNFVRAGSDLGAWGFAAAVALGTLAVAAVHLWA